MMSRRGIWPSLSVLQGILGVLVVHAADVRIVRQETHEEANLGEVAPLGTAAVRLVNSIMRSWAEVNTARMLSSNNVPHFYPRVMSSYLELYETLCDLITHAPLLPHELAPTTNILHGLFISHQELCTEYNSIISQSANYLLLAIIKTWSLVVQLSLTSPADEKNGQDVKI